MSCNDETEIGATLMFGDQTLTHSMDPALKIFIDENADDMAEECVNICKQNGIKTKAHLVELSRYESLLAKFPVAPALQMIQALDAESHSGTKCSGAIKALSSLSVDAVTSVMLNYGIVSALMCSISAGIFGGVAADEWKLYEENIAPNWESCVAAATNTSVWWYSTRFDSLEECVAYWTETQQWWLIQFNVWSIGFNMFVVWVATYLYIALMFSDIKKENKEEQEIRLPYDDAIHCCHSDLFPARRWFVWLWCHHVRSDQGDAPTHCQMVDHHEQRNRRHHCLGPPSDVLYLEPDSSQDWQGAHGSGAGSPHREPQAGHLKARLLNAVQALTASGCGLRSLHVGW